MAHSGARGTLIYEKNLKSKISCQTPFKCTDVLLETSFGMYKIVQQLRYNTFFGRYKPKNQTFLLKGVWHEIFSFKFFS